VATFRWEMWIRVGWSSVGLNDESGERVVDGGVHGADSLDGLVVLGALGHAGLPCSLDGRMCLDGAAFPSPGWTGPQSGTRGWNSHLACSGGCAQPYARCRQRSARGQLRRRLKTADYVNASVASPTGELVAEGAV
jgi:hypothetical protein